MNLPSGLVFYLDFQYGQDKELNFGPAGDAFGSSNGGGSGSLYGNTNPGASSDPTQGLYGSGRFGYSINQFSQSVGVSVATASWSDVDYQAEKSASIASGDFTTVTVESASVVLTRPDLKGARAFVLASGSDVNSYFQPSLDILLPEFTRVDGDAIKFVYQGAQDNANVPKVGSSTSNIVFYNQQPVDNNRGDFEDAANAGRPNSETKDSPSDPLAIPQIDIKMRSEAIVAKTRKLKAQWTPEFAQDLNAYQALDAEAELTSIMSEYISLEIDLEILDMLIQDASAADEYWNASNNQNLNSDKTAYTDLGFYNTQGQWFQTLGTKMQKVSNKIHQKTLRGGANFAVISPSVSTVLESIPGYASNSDGNATTAKYAFGIQKIGQMNNRLDIYKNPYMTENVILMGYRGSQFLETGAVFAPYIPLIMTPLVYDPDTFTPRKGLLTRYAKKMIRPEFYGRVFCSNIGTI